jgi:hypothetical protein
MPKLSYRDTLEALCRKPAFQKDVKALYASKGKPKTLDTIMQDIFSGKTDKEMTIKDRMRKAGIPHAPSPNALSRQATPVNLPPVSASVTPRMRVVPDSQGEQAYRQRHPATTGRVSAHRREYDLRQGRFLGLEIDLTQRDPIALVRQHILAARQQAAINGRERKADVDHWTAYRRHYDDKQPIYQIARQLGQPRDYVRKAIRKAEGMIKAVNYPSE